MDIEFFKQISTLPDLLETMAKLIFPTIYDNEHIKRSMVLSLFLNQAANNCEDEGNVGIFAANEHLHILLIGATGEEIMSQMLKAITQVINKSNYILGNQSSYRLLAASFNRNGKLIGKGSFMNVQPAIICIDGLEKMDYNQQHLIIQSIEHQLVTHKSGHCGHWYFRSNSTILATAFSKEFAYLYKLEQNSSVSKHLLARFDLIFSIEKAAIKEKHSVFINRMRKEKAKANENLDPVVSQRLKSSLTVSMLNDYIAYCNQHIDPVFPDHLMQIAEEYSKQDQSHLATGNYRLLIAITNLAKSHARLHMRAQVVEDDLLIALELMAFSLTFNKPDQENLPLSSQLSNSKNISCKPSKLYKLLLEAASVYNKRQFTVDEIVDMLLKLANPNANIDQSQVLNSVVTLNEQGLLVKRSSKLYELL